MSHPSESIEAQPLALPAEERVRLADRLLASIFDDADIEAAWSAEVEKRIEAIEAGRARLIPVMSRSLLNAERATALG